MVSKYNSSPVPILFHYLRSIVCQQNKVEPVNSRRSVTTSKDSLLKGDEMLFVLIVCFAMGDICNVHHCNNKGSNTVRRQTVYDDKIIYQMPCSVLVIAKTNRKKRNFLVLIVPKVYLFAITLQTVFSTFRTEAVPGVGSRSPVAWHSRQPA